MAQSAKTILVAKGRTFSVFRQGDEQFDKAETLIVGPTGNLRAPAFRYGNRLIVGFHQQMYQEVFG